MAEAGPWISIVSYVWQVAGTPGHWRVAERRVLQDLEHDKLELRAITEDGAIQRRGLSGASSYAIDRDTDELHAFGRPVFFEVEVRVPAVTEAGDTANVSRELVEKEPPPQPGAATGQPTQETFKETLRRVKLGDEDYERIANTSLDSAKEKDALRKLKDGRPGLVAKLIGRAAAGEKVSALRVCAALDEGWGLRLSDDELINRTMPAESFDVAHVQHGLAKPTEAATQQTSHDNAQSPPARGPLRGRAVNRAVKLLAEHEHFAPGEAETLSTAQIRQRLKNKQIENLPSLSSFDRALGRRT
jgi:hypothetical protein